MIEDDLTFIKGLLSPLDRKTIGSNALYFFGKRRIKGGGKGVEIDKKLIQLSAKLELSRREFFFYCFLKAPDFYKKNREHLVSLCDAFQRFIKSDEEVLIINLPP